MNKEKELIDKLIDLAFAEDIGDGDHRSEERRVGKECRL